MSRVQKRAQTRRKDVAVFKMIIKTTGEEADQKMRAYHKRTERGQNIREW